MKLSDYLSKKAKPSDPKAKGWLMLCTLDVPTGSLWAGDPHLANADDGCVVKVTPGRYVVEAVGQRADTDGEAVSVVGWIAHSEPGDA